MSTPALDRCHAVLANHSKSFAMAGRLLPRRQRDAAAVVYAWCRAADDAIDLVEPKEQPAALGRLRAQLDDVYAGRATQDPVLDSFSQVARDLPIPRHYPEELLAGMEMDCSGRGYETPDDLLHYCWRVAGVVGLMMAHVLTVRDAEALRRAAHMGMAMQLTNVCRDVLEDWERGRLYLPADRLATHGAPGLAEHLGGPFPAEAVPAAARVVSELLEEAECFYRSGDAGLDSLPLGCSPSIRAARSIYSAIGGRIRALDCDPTRGRAYLGRMAKLRLALRAVAVEVGALPRRLLARRTEPRPPEAGRVVHFPRDVLPLVP